MNMNMNMIYKKSTFIIIFKNAHLGGRVVLSYERLMGMCRWMGSHFHNWIDYNEVAFSIELLEWGRTFSDFLG